MFFPQKKTKTCKTHQNKQKKKRVFHVCSIHHEFHPTSPWLPQNSPRTSSELPHNFPRTSSELPHNSSELKKTTQASISVQKLELNHETSVSKSHNLSCCFIFAFMIFPSISPSEPPQNLLRTSSELRQNLLRTSSEPPQKPLRTYFHKKTHVCIQKLKF